jgi:hypothetical protein
MGALGFPIAFWKVGAAVDAGVGFDAGDTGDFVCGLAKTVVAIAHRATRVTTRIGRTVRKFTRRSPWRLDEQRILTPKRVFLYRIDVERKGRVTRQSPEMFSIAIFSIAVLRIEVSVRAVLLRASQ